MERSESNRPRRTHWWKVKSSMAIGSRCSTFFFVASRCVRACPNTILHNAMRCYTIENKEGMLKMNTIVSSLTNHKRVLIQMWSSIQYKTIEYIHFLGATACCVLATTLSLMPNLHSGIPERWHFRRIDPLTCEFSTWPMYSMVSVCAVCMHACLLYSKYL